MSSDMERLRDELDRHEGRLDDHLRRIIVVEAETERTRARLHRMESDRAAVRALVKTTQQLAEQTRILASKVISSVDQSEQLVEAAAERAVEKVYGRRLEHRWRLTIRVAGLLTAVGGIGFLIENLFIH